jgi:hypothetical protein
MWIHDMSNSRFAFVFCTIAPACALILSAGVAHGGSERISLTAQGATVYQSGASDVVPVTVQLANGRPDYIDLTYYATDGNNQPVTVTPTSGRVYLTHLQSSTQNVIVNTPTSSPSTSQYPVTFVALAQGEAADADSEAYTQSIAHIGGQGATTQVRAQATAGSLTATIDSNKRSTVPVSASLSSGIATVTMVYTASDGTNPVGCKPSQEDMSLKAGSDVLRGVLCNVDNDGATVTFTVAPTMGGTPLTPTIPYTIGGPQQTQQYTITGGATLTVKVGASSLLDQQIATVTLTPSNSNGVTIYYSAMELDASGKPTGVTRECCPNRVTHDTIANHNIQDMVTVDLAGSTAQSVQFTAIAIDVDNNRKVSFVVKGLTP